MYKVVVFVPVADAEKLRQAIGNAGGGKIGAYSHCNFSSRGTGRFLPSEKAKPAIGKAGKLEEVEEERIEFVCETHCLDEVVAAIRKAHPYEEPAIETWKIEMK
ncbi:hypothetical protein A3C21_03650 [Candidatus Kaiserbacteria bacterium RIFCSPHIGHO2_02_FULL_59_21]|uniref:NGG1p interacting factor NIF3 n=2 Tax=Candidatus Kaiseribacteriota TaxID=1752734 RepID=A0A0G1YVU9_9BACT|nr:MAG: hypothetical protein UY98_C0015G0003 [Candidatus Kaiserbacteria bacterium GW2011_GWA2_58_9]OGG63156.1 MAG: hypothetical protein A2766_00145 [Candidatus Kaiserbacteria bacterium RIFCSPHIGHO2_01_FULL_58_22]OGG66774.1 MAG: hypothetical protein A3C21_03650 [Candidatus Kaiserbacteria bacterium RIFCSPHIGHO2_02_FULL_59_21]OGG87095.1 MAG: hypothetical protein A3I47_02415 [Candidatus Kaiserbacteria bacterium RIFCSPLOWO2_02_FULL_59_19]